jgi:hypothetical protein
MLALFVLATASFSFLQIATEQQVTSLLKVCAVRRPCKPWEGFTRE